MKFLKSEQQGPWVYETYALDNEETYDMAAEKYMQEYYPVAYNTSVFKKENETITFKRWYTAD